jgi:hypothetical protein
VQILKYIEGYSWQIHLERENEKLIGQDVESLAEESVEKEVGSSESGTTVKKRTWYQAIADWIRNLFK